MNMSAGEAQGEMLDYVIEKLNTLSFAKGMQPKCELTGLPATVQLVTPHITLYFATKAHAEQAWEGIMHKISRLLGPLRAPAAIVGSEEERAKREYTLQMSKRALIDLCQQEASKFLVAEKGELAIPGAIQALKFCKEIYGEGSIEMVPPYLLLAEANLDLGRLQQAEEFLSLANWSVLKSPDCSNAIRSQLHRNFGKLYSAQMRFDEALAELSKDIYFSSLEVGPEHVDTSAGYFHMANILYGQQRIEGSLAYYDKVVDIWYKFLASVRVEPEMAEAFSEAQLNEGMDMLSRILSTRVKLLGEDHIATGEARYTLGLLQLFVGGSLQALESISKASKVYTKHLGVDHPSSRDVLDVYEQLMQGQIGAGPPFPGGGTGGMGGMDGSTGQYQQQQQQHNNGGGGGGGASNLEAMMKTYPANGQVQRLPNQSPIPLPPNDSAGGRGGGGGRGMVGAVVDDSMQMVPP